MCIGTNVVCRREILGGLRAQIGVHEIASSEGARMLVRASANATRVDHDSFKTLFAVDSNHNFHTL